MLLLIRNGKLIQRQNNKLQQHDQMDMMEIFYRKSITPAESFIFKCQFNYLPIIMCV